MKPGTLNKTVSLIVNRAAFRAKIAGIYYLRKRKSKKHCFILCDPRTGSNLLLSYLNSNPHAYFGGEILCPTQAISVRLKLITKKAVFRHMRHFINHRNYPICGAKLFFSHLEERGIALTELAQEFPDAQWIVLYRKNIFDQYLSMQFLLQTGRSSHPIDKRYEKPEPIRIQRPIPKTLWLEHCQKIQDRYKAVLKIQEMREKSLWISYEELASTPQKLFDEAIFPFLDLPQNHVKTNLMKQNVWEYPEIIANYEDIKDFIKQTDSTHSYHRYPVQAAS